MFANFRLRCCCCIPVVVWSARYNYEQLCLSCRRCKCLQFAVVFLVVCLVGDVTSTSTSIFVQMKYEAMSSKRGPLHGLLLSTPYMTKDHLQLKRFQAQTNGTTYIYDFPEMFRQVSFCSVLFCSMIMLDRQNNEKFDVIIINCVLLLIIFYNIIKIYYVKLKYHLSHIIVLLLVWLEHMIIYANFSIIIIIIIIIHNHPGPANDMEGNTEQMPQHESSRRGLVKHRAGLGRQGATCRDQQTARNQQGQSLVLVFEVPKPFMVHVLVHVLVLVLKHLCLDSWVVVDLHFLEAENYFWFVDV